MKYQNELDEFIDRKKKDYDGDIRREIAECFSCYVQEKYPDDKINHKKVTRQALESI
jgi:hypothetical protein